MTQVPALPVAILGAGPTGLAAAAELALRGLDFIVIEQGPAVGHAIRQWGQIRLFSPWGFNIAQPARALLAKTGWPAPDPNRVPTGAEIVADYLEPLAALPAIRDRLRLGTRVVTIARAGIDKVQTNGRAQHPFRLRLDDGSSVTARAVIDASGTWFSPNPLGADGVPATGEAASADHIVYGLPDVRGQARARYAGRRVLVVGAGHSAINTAIDLAALATEAPGTEVHWAMRRRDLTALYGGGKDDALPERGALGAAAKALLDSGKVTLHTPFLIDRIDPAAGGLAVAGDLNGSRHQVTVDEIIVCTGFRPDLSLTREVRVAVDPWLEAVPALAPLIDPNVHSCGTVPPHGVKELTQPEPDYYVVGMKSYGRAPTFLMATGYEQVRSVVAALAGDHAAAERVDLVLPETGVCSAGPGGGAAAAGCCG